MAPAKALYVGVPCGIAVELPLDRMACLNCLGVIAPYSKEAILVSARSSRLKAWVLSLQCLAQREVLWTSGPPKQTESYVTKDIPHKIIRGIAAGYA
ncbi:hypothetical protein BV20DRAFT_971048 [Pilatotrama ljubarskyi]|nr:hypothetical protein BV20DRAFT_971048 [Pilatotrama ljubarskyi]